MWSSLSFVKLLTKYEEHCTEMALGVKLLLHRNVSTLLSKLRFVQVRAGRELSDFFYSSWFEAIMCVKLYPKTHFCFLNSDTNVNAKTRKLY